MAKTLQFRRGTTSELSVINGAEGELFVDTSKNTVVVMDGVTNGGYPLQAELVSNVNIKTINGSSILGSGDITISGGAGGDIVTNGDGSKSIIVSGVITYNFGPTNPMIYGTSAVWVVGTYLSLDNPSAETQAIFSSLAVGDTFVMGIGSTPSTPQTFTFVSISSGAGYYFVNIQENNTDKNAIDLDVSYITATSQFNYNFSNVGNLTVNSTVFTKSTDFKTINGSSILGSGDLTVSASLAYSTGTALGDNSTVDFTIASGRTVHDILVFVNGICFTPTDDYTISGTTLTFASAPGDLAEITFRYLPI